MYGWPSAPPPRARRSAEIACSRLLSVTATSRQAGFDERVLRQHAPGVRDQVQQNLEWRSDSDTGSSSRISRRDAVSSSKGPNA